MSYIYIGSHWLDPNNRRNLLNSFARDKGFDPLIASNWYSLDTLENFLHTPKVCALLSYIIIYFIFKTHKTRGKRCWYITIRMLLKLCYTYTLTLAWKLLNFLPNQVLFCSLFPHSPHSTSFSLISYFSQ
jgi:hypothetical protein